MPSDTPMGWVLDAETRTRLRLEKAERARRHADWSAVVVELEELLDEDPHHAEALWRLLEAWLALRDFTTGRETARAAIEATGGRPALWHALALCAFECCAFDEAIDAARRALAICEDLPDTQALLGLALQRTGDPSAAEHLALAHRMNPTTQLLPLRVTEEDWRMVVAEAFAQLPPALQDFWRPVPVELRDHPEAAELLAHVPPLSPRVVALYVGTPPDAPDGRARPEGLRIFRGNLVHNDSLEGITHQLVLTLEQEAMDWLPEDD